MHYLYPNILFLSVLAVLPFILHFHKKIRRKKIYFPYVFLFENEIKGKSRRSRFEELLLLILRVLIILLTVNLLASPNIKRKNKGEKKVLIFFDNTKSLLYLENNETLINTMKRKLPSILSNFSSKTSYTLVSADGRLNKNLNKKELLKTIKSLKPAENIISPIKAMQILGRQKSAEKDNLYLIISDFRKNRYEGFDFKNEIKTIQAGPSDKRNVSLTRVNYLKRVYYKGEKLKLYFSLKNHSRFDEKPVLRINQNSKTIYEKTFNLKGFKTINSKVDILLKKGTHNFNLKIQNDNFPYDNGFNFKLRVKPDLKILIYSKNQFLKKLLSRCFGPGYFKEKRSIIIHNNEKINNYDVVIINSLKKIVPKGRLATILIPNINDDITFLNSLINKFTDLIDLKSIIRNQILIKPGKKMGLNSSLGRVYAKSYFRVDTPLTGYLRLGPQNLIYKTDNFIIFTTGLSPDNTNFLISPGAPVIFDKLLYKESGKIKSNIIFKNNENHIESLNLSGNFKPAEITEIKNKDFIRPVLFVLIILLLAGEIIILVRRDYVKKVLASKHST